MIIRYSVICFLSIVTLVLAVIFFNKGMGNAFFMQADYSLKEWSKAGKIVDKHEYVQSLASINKALEYDSKNPHYYNAKARILDWGIASNFEPIESNHKIEELYLTSVAFRKHWPVTWIELAAAHSYTYGVDNKTLQYIDSAYKFGPFNKDVIRISLSILLSNWDLLEPEVKTKFYQFLELSSRNVNLFRKVLGQAKQIQKQKIICLQIKYNKAYERYKNSRLDKQFCS